MRVGRMFAAAASFCGSSDASGSARKCQPPSREMVETDAGRAETANISMQRRKHIVVRIESLEFESLFVSGEKRQACSASCGADTPSVHHFVRRAHISETPPQLCYDPKFGVSVEIDS